MRSVDQLSHHPSVERLARSLRPREDARRGAAIDLAITPDGKVRADRLAGFVSPHQLPLDALERGILVDLDPPSMAAGAVGTVAVTVPGAKENDAVALGPPSDLEAGLLAFGVVTADDTVTIRFFNASGGTLDPAANTWKVVVTR